MLKFRVAVTDDLMHADGTMAFPDYSLAGLQADFRVEFKRIAGTPRIEAADLTDVDVLISVPMAAPLTAHSFPGTAGPLAIVRVGVGFEDVDVDACTRNHAALIIPRDAVQRPTAVAALTLILALATRLIEKHRLDSGRACGMAPPGSVAGYRLGRQSARNSWLRQHRIRSGRAVPAIGHAVSGRRPGSFTLAGAGPRRRDRDPARHAFAGGFYLHPLPPEQCHSRHYRRRGAADYEVIQLHHQYGTRRNCRSASPCGRVAVAAYRRRRIGRICRRTPVARRSNILPRQCGVVRALLNWTRELDVDLSQSNVRSIESLLAGAVPEGVVNTAVLRDPIFLARLRSLSSEMDPKIAQ